jgi:hypothetical protein
LVPSQETSLLLAAIRLLTALKDAVFLIHIQWEMDHTHPEGRGFSFIESNPRTPHKPFTMAGLKPRHSAVAYFKNGKYC